MTKINFKGNVGCEFECCLDPDTAFPKIKGWKKGYDPSVHSQFRNNPCELRSKKYTIKKVKEFLKDFETVSKSIAEVNSSCGLHIHISFKKLHDYYKLFSWDFVCKFQDLIKQKFKLKLEKTRLNNTFCQLYQCPSDFLKISNAAILCRSRSHRYHSVNFNSYNILKTVEFRVFPGVKSPVQFKKYLMMLLKFVDNYLQSKKLEPNSMEVPKMPKPKDVESNFVDYVETKPKSNEINFIEHIKPISKDKKEIQIVDYLNEPQEKE